MADEGMPMTKSVPKQAEQFEEQLPDLEYSKLQTPTYVRQLAIHVQANSIPVEDGTQPLSHRRLGQACEALHDKTLRTHSPLLESLADDLNNEGQDWIERGADQISAFLAIFNDAVEDSRFEMDSAPTEPVDWAGVVLPLLTAALDGVAMLGSARSYDQDDFTDNIIEAVDIQRLGYDTGLVPTDAAIALGIATRGLFRSWSASEHRVNYHASRWFELRLDGPKLEKRDLIPSMLLAYGSDRINRYSFLEPVDIYRHGAGLKVVERFNGRRVIAEFALDLGTEVTLLPDGIQIPNVDRRHARLHALTEVVSSSDDSAQNFDLFGRFAVPGSPVDIPDEPDVEPTLVASFDEPYAVDGE